MSCTACMALWLLSTPAQAGIIPIGSSYTIQGTNAPTNFGPQTLTFDQTTKSADGGLLNVTEIQVPTTGGGEWDVFSVATADGGPLAGNINAYWSLGWGFDISQPSLFDATAIWWTANGVAFDPIYAFGGICCPATNPVNPAWGQAYYNTFTGDPVDGFVTFNPTIYVSPYNFISSGGMDPMTANGFNFAFHFTPQSSPVPEPFSFLLVGTGCAALLVRRRLKRE
jgi:hypothetical protein